MTHCRRWFLVPAVAFAVAVPQLVAGAARTLPEAEQVLEEMEEASEPSGKMRADLEIRMTSREGEEVSWQGELYWRGEPGMAEGIRRLVLDEPDDVEGVEYLIQRSSDGIDRVQMYLPALKRSRTIRTELHGEPFLGTDFNYEDLGLDRLEFQEHEVIGESEVDGRPCIQLQSVPDEPFGYGRVVRCVDKEMHLPLRTEYFDRAQRLWKVRTIDETVKIDGDVIPTHIVMQDVQAETQSVIELSDVRLDPVLPDEAFTLLGTRAHGSRTEGVEG